MKRFPVIITALFLVISCSNNDTPEAETNGIFGILTNQSRDSTAVYFQKNYFLGKGKIQMVTHPKEGDSVAVHFKSVDSLQFKIPITRDDFHKYELVKHPKIDAVISNSVIEQWNNQIKHYNPHTWSKKEQTNLPIIKKEPNELKGNSGTEGELQKVLYFSTPFFNKTNTKALVYEYQFPRSGKIGQLYILSKEDEKWNIIYRGNTFVSSF